MLLYLLLCRRLCTSSVVRRVAWEEGSLAASASLIEIAVAKERGNNAGGLAGFPKFPSTCLG